MAFVNHLTQKKAEMNRHVKQKKNPELLDGLNFAAIGLEKGVKYLVAKKKWPRNDVSPY